MLMGGGRGWQDVPLTHAADVDYKKERQSKHMTSVLDHIILRREQ